MGITDLKNIKINKNFLLAAFHHSQ